MKKETVTVALAAGLDVREIALCVQTASKFNSAVYLADGTKRMNAKSLMGLMAMGLALGDQITVETEGSDEEEACQAMCAFFTGNN